MNRGLLLFLIVIGCAVNSIAADGGPRTLEDSILGVFRTMSHDVPEDILEPNKNPLPPLEEMLLGAAQRAGATKAQLQEKLFEIVERGYESVRKDPERWYPLYANAALRGLGELADATAVDRLAALALAAPRGSLLSSARQAAVYAADREALDKLPNVVRQLAQGEDPHPVFWTLQHILETRLPADPEARARHLATIVAILKEGLHYENAYQSHLDGLLEKYDDAYRTSDVRKRVMKELSNGENEYDKKYGVRILREVFGRTDEASVAAIPIVPRVSPKALMQAPAVKPNDEPRQGARSSFQWASFPVLVGGAIVFVLLVFLWRRASSR